MFSKGLLRGFCEETIINQAENEWCVSLAVLIHPVFGSLGLEAVLHKAAT